VERGHPTEATIERYIRRELAAEERQDFEEHLIECSQCFEEIQTMEQFVAGIRHSSRSGTLAEPALPGRLLWIAVALAASLAIALISGGIWISQLRSTLHQAAAARDALQVQLAESRPPAASSQLQAQNLPIAVLKAERAATSETLLKLPVSATALALWMDVEPAGRYRTFAVSLSDSRGRALEHVAGLTRNSEGAVSLILPSPKLLPGLYTVRLSSEDPPRLLAEYRLRIAAE
jgi:Putative zinc-finger